MTAAPRLPFSDADLPQLSPDQVAFREAIKREFEASAAAPGEKMALMMGFCVGVLVAGAQTPRAARMACDELCQHIAQAAHIATQGRG